MIMMTSTALNLVIASYRIITKKLKISGSIIRVIVNCAYCKCCSNTFFKVFLITFNLENLGIILVQEVLFIQSPKMFTLTIQI